MEPDWSRSGPRQKLDSKALCSPMCLDLGHDCHRPLEVLHRDVCACQLTVDSYSIINRRQNHKSISVKCFQALSCVKTLQVSISSSSQNKVGVRGLNTHPFHGQPQRLHPVPRRGQHSICCVSPPQLDSKRPSPWRARGSRVGGRSVRKRCHDQSQSGLAR